MLKATLAVGVAVVVVVGGIVGFNLYRDRMIEESFAERSAPAVTVSTTTVEPSEWQPAIETIGTLDAARGAQLSVETAGIVTAIDFEANDDIEKGEVILRLDDAVEQAVLEAAETAADLDRQSLQRQQELRRRRVNTEADLDEARAAAAASAAEARRASALLQEKRVLAPFDGTIGIARVEVGQYVNPGDPVAALQDFSRLYVDFSLPQQDLDRVEIGQEARVRMDGRDEPLSGSVVGIDADVDPDSRLVEVRVALDNTDERILPGKFVRVEVLLPLVSDVIAIPQTALVTSLYGDHVFVVEPAGESSGESGDRDGGDSGGGSSNGGNSGSDGERQLVARQVFVEVGRRGTDRVEIVGGLEAGAEVINAGQNRLSDGASVKVDNSVDPTSNGNGSGTRTAQSDGGGEGG